MPRKTKAAPPGVAPFDPWTASFEEGVSHFANDEGVTDAHMQWIRARSISARREAIEQGSGFDVLQAVADCANAALPLPSWLGAAFVARFNAVKFHEAASWDDPKAFDKPLPKGTHRARLKKDYGAGPVVFGKVQQLLVADPSRAIDESLFEEVAQHFKGKVAGLGRSECQRIFYASVQEHKSILGPARPVAIAAKTPKIAVRRRKA